MEDHRPTTEVAPIGAGDRDLQPGDKVGEYEVEAKIGEGGFGTVFRAVHPLIGKLVAIKVLARQYSAQPEMVSRFVAEARAVNQIRHRHIIDIFAFGQLADGRHYYVMELLDGQPLDEYIASVGHVPLDEAIPILRAIARALDAAHGKGIAHRDLKPENVFLARDADGAVFPKLLDFGIAKLLSTSSSAPMHKTRTGAPIGTPYYMSPEQCRGRDVDHRTDVYAFGVMAFKLLTGRVPFDGDDYMDILLKQLHEQPPLPSAIVPTLPAAVDHGIGWMLQKDPAARPPNLVTAVRALEDAAAAAGYAIPSAAPTGVHAARSTSQLSSAATTPAGPALASAARSGLGSAPGTGLGSAATVDAASLSDAMVPLLPTLAPATLAPAATSSAPTTAAAPTMPPPSRRWLFPSLAAAVGIGAAGVAFVVLARPAPPATPAPPTTATATPPAAAAEAPPVPPPMTPALIVIDVAGPPAGTEVFGPGGRLLGTAPGRIQLEPSARDVILTFKADGFVTRSLPVTPVRDQAIDVALEPRASRTAPAPATSSDDRPPPQRARPPRSDEPRRPKPAAPARTRDSIEDPFKMP